MTSITFQLPLALAEPAPGGISQAGGEVW